MASVLVKMDAPLGVLAVLLYLVDAALELAYALVHALFDLAYALLDVKPRVLAQSIQLAAQVGVVAALLGEHLLYAYADPLDLLVESGAGLLGRDGGVVGIAHNQHSTGAAGRNLRGKRSLQPSSAKRR